VLEGCVEGAELGGEARVVGFVVGGVLPGVGVFFVGLFFFGVGWGGGGGGGGVRREGEASRPLSVREGRARVRVCVMYY
jgi:hypothetical protein